MSAIHHGKKFKLWAELNGFKPEFVAEHVGSSQPSLSRFYREDDWPRMRKFAFLYAFNLSSDFFNDWVVGL